MGKFILNGKNYCGLIDAQGVFIDTDTIIKAETTVQANTTATYTATVDCCVRVKLRCASGVASNIQIDGVEVGAIYNADMTVYFSVYYLKKGQTITITTSYESSYAVYAIQMGSEVTFLSEYASACYDTNEREVGCWVDGKPIYQKTITVNSVSLPATDGVDVLLSDYGINDVEKIIDIKGRDETVNAYIPYLAQSGNTLYLITISSDNPLKLRISRNGGAVSNQTFVITVQYTKTTDTAGSGKLTPTEMPTVHYDGNEKVIGTWFGETLYEKSFKLPSAITLPSNTWTDTGVSISGIKNIVNGFANRNGTQMFACGFSIKNNTTLVQMQTYFNNLSCNTDTVVTVQYTKTS